MYVSVLGDLLNYTYTGLEWAGGKPVEPSLIIFIHALKNGLFRIHMEGQSLRYGFLACILMATLLICLSLGCVKRAPQQCINLFTLCFHFPSRSASYAFRVLILVMLW